MAVVVDSTNKFIRGTNVYTSVYRIFHVEIPELSASKNKYYPSSEKIHSVKMAYVYLLLELIIVINEVFLHTKFLLSYVWEGVAFLNQLD